MDPIHLCGEEGRRRGREDARWRLEEREEEIRGGGEGRRGEEKA